MKKILFVALLALPIYALCQAVSPSPVPLPMPEQDPSTIPTLTALLSLARGWQSMGLYVALATALKLLVDLSKLSLIGKPFEKIPEKYRLLVVTLVGTLITALGLLAAHVPLAVAIVSALGSAVGASFVHELIKDFVPGSDKQDVGQPPAAA